MPVRGNAQPAARRKQFVSPALLTRLRSHPKQRLRPARPNQEPAVLGRDPDAVQRRHVVVGVGHRLPNAVHHRFLLVSFHAVPADGVLRHVGGAVAQVAAGSLADAVGDRPVLVAVSAATIPVLVAIPTVDSVIGVAAASLLLGIRLGVPAVSNAYIIAILPESVTGTAWGVLRTTSFMLAATGSTVVGVMADSDLFDEAFFLLAGLTALGTLLYTRLPDR